MRNISFSLTTPQFISRTKTVTRRLGWGELRPGDILCGIEKGQGLKRGEKVKRLGKIRIVSVRREQLSKITSDDVAREGFPELSRSEFISLFCKGHSGCTQETWVTRIEFEHLDEK